VIKRIVWLLLGITVGVMAVLRTQRSLRRRADRLRPERMASDLAASLRAFGVDLRKAVAEGRSAMVEREAELNVQLQARTGADT
jgi:hypothetical protein